MLLEPFRWAVETINDATGLNEKMGKIPRMSELFFGPSGP